MGLTGHIRGKVSITQASDQGNRKMPSCPQKRGLIQVSSRRRKIGKTQAGKGAQVMPRRNDTRSGRRHRRELARFLFRQG